MLPTIFRKLTENFHTVLIVLAIVGLNIGTASAVHSSVVTDERQTGSSIVYAAYSDIVESTVGAIETTAGEVAAGINEAATEASGNNGCFEILGLCWLWWLLLPVFLLVAATPLLILAWWLLTRRRDRKEEENA